MSWSVAAVGKKGEIKKAFESAIARTSENEKTRAVLTAVGGIVQEVLKDVDQTDKQFIVETSGHVDSGWGGAKVEIRTIWQPDPVQS